MKVPFGDSFSPRQRRFALWVLGLLLFYTIAGFFILPVIVRRVAADRLSRQLDREVSIQAVKINPFVLSASVRGLLVKDKDGEPFIAWDEVYVNFQLASFFGKAWVFREISATKPFVRAEMNKDGTFNFSDLIAKFSPHAASAEKKSGPPLLLHVDRLQISGATAAVADLSARTPYRRLLGPLDLTLENFRTAPDNKNPYAFSGTTDTGERYVWRGQFSLEPLSSAGEILISQVALNKYAPLYQDFVSFEIRSGSVGLRADYRFVWSASNHVAAVTNAAFALRDFKLGQTGNTDNIIELPLLGASGVAIDLEKRRAEIGSAYVRDGKIFLNRAKDASLNVVKLAQPSEPAAVAPNGILFLLRSVTNAVALLLDSTNQWSGLVRSVTVTNCAVHWEDDVNSRPAKLNLTDIALAAKNISNLPGTNLAAQLSLRWNTNGAIKITTAASFLPPTADAQLDFDELDLNTLDAYLEPKLNLFILGSRIGLHGQVHLRTPQNQLPEVTFHGDTRLDGFRTVDGVFGEDLLKWDSLRFNGIDANLNPPTVAIREIDVDNAYARFVIETNKTINLLNALRLTNTVASAAGETKVAAAPKTAGETDSTLPRISIGAVVITNTALSFSDRSIKPEVNLSIRDVNGSVADFSTEQLRHATLRLGAKIDGVGPATVTGTLNPFSGAETNDIKVSVANMDLTPASPYVGKFAGYRLAEGKLNLDLAYELIGTKLNAKNVITLDRFNFGEKVNSPDATSLPVRLAVAILKDREGKIVLDVPVEGNLSDPKFRVGKVVTRALLNILEKAATSPFSLLGAVFGGGEELGYQDFALGSAELTAADRQKLDTLQKALFARPALKLEITGGVDPDGDREGLQRAALDREIRARLWQKLNQNERATNAVEQLALTPEIRARGLKQIYDAAVASGKINAEFIAAHTNLAAFAASILPKPARPAAAAKGATLLVNPSTAAPKPEAAGANYPSRLTPPPDATEAVLLATVSVTDEDLETLAAARAARVRDYLVETGKVEASRVFLKSGQTESFRKDGSRAWLQLQ
jgi:hypothetical protein